MVKLNRKFIAFFLVCFTAFHVIHATCTLTLSEWESDTIVKYLTPTVSLEDSCLYKIDLKGNSLLISSVLYENRIAVQNLIALGVDISLKNNWGGTAFNQACSKGLDLTKLIMSRGYIPSNSEIVEGVYFALQMEQYDVVRFIVDSIIDSVDLNYSPVVDGYYEDSTLNLREDLIANALFRIVNKDSAWLDILYFIYNNGLTPNRIRTYYKINNFDIFNPDKIQAMINKSVIDSLSFTPLLLAIRQCPEKYNHSSIVNNEYNNYVKGIERLLELGADVNFCNEYGVSALHMAARYATDDIVRLLISYGAKINITDKRGWTPLLIASSRKAGLDIVKLLLSNGADPKLINIYGKSSIDYAATNLIKSTLNAASVPAGADLQSVPMND